MLLPCRHSAVPGMGSVSSLTPPPMLLPCRHSAVLGMGSVSSLRTLRDEVNAAAAASGEAKAPSLLPVGPRPPNQMAAVEGLHPHIRSWHLPFPGGYA